MDTVVGEINREQNYGANCRARMRGQSEREREREREIGCKLIVDCPIKERNFIGNRVEQAGGIGIISLKARYTNR